MNAYGNDPYRARTATTGVAIKPGLRVAAIIAAVLGITGFFVCVGTASAAMIMATTARRTTTQRRSPTKR